MFLVNENVNANVNFKVNVNNNCNAIVNVNIVASASVYVIVKVNIQLLLIQILRKCSKLCTITRENGKNFSKVHISSMKANEIDNNTYKNLVKVYGDFETNKKIKLVAF